MWLAVSYRDSKNSLGQLIDHTRNVGTSLLRLLGTCPNEWPWSIVVSLILTGVDRDAESSENRPPWAGLGQRWKKTRESCGVHVEILRRYGYQSPLDVHMHTLPWGTLAYITLTALRHDYIISLACRRICCLREPDQSKQCLSSLSSAKLSLQGVLTKAKVSSYKEQNCARLQT